MVDQAQPVSPGSENPDASFVEGNAGGKGRFPPRGRPVIRGINGIGLWSLYMKEVRRFLKVQTQTIWAPAITTLLFLVIFSVALGRGGRQVWAIRPRLLLRIISNGARQSGTLETFAVKHTHADRRIEI